MSRKEEHNASRREFVKGVGKIAYVAPVILTLQAMPSFASAGSGRPQNVCSGLWGQDLAECLRSNPED